MKEASALGDKVRYELEYFNVKSLGLKKYVMPEQLLIINEDGEIQMNNSEIEVMEGVSGTKIVLGLENTFKI